MAALASSASVTVVLQAGQVLSVAPTSGQTANVVIGGQTNAGVAAKTSYGPFDHPVRCTVTAVGGAVDWQAAEPGEICPANATPFSSSVVVTTASQVLLRAAQQPGVSQCVTEVLIQNSSVVPTTLTIQDGSATLLTVNATASMVNAISVPLLVPIAGSAATALNCIAGTTGANVMVHVSGFNRH